VCITKKTDTVEAQAFYVIKHQDLRLLRLTTLCKTSSHCDQLASLISSIQFTSHALPSVFW